MRYSIVVPGGYPPNVIYIFGMNWDLSVAIQMKDADAMLVRLTTLEGPILAAPEALELVRSSRPDARPLPTITADLVRGIPRTGAAGNWDVPIAEADDLTFYHDLLQSREDLWQEVLPSIS